MVRASCIVPMVHRCIVQASCVMRASCVVWVSYVVRALSRAGDASVVRTSVVASVGHRRYGCKHADREMEKNC
jgi:hypothetical protein